MTREQIRQQFPEATEEQITTILNINGADLTEAKKNNVDPKELKKLREESEAYQKLQDAGLTDEEKIQKTLKAAEEAKSNYKRQLSKLEVEKILVSAGLTEEDYKDFVEGLVSEDAEKSKALATGLSKTLTAQKDAATQKTKEELMDGTKGGGSGAGGENKGDEKSQAEKIAERLYSGKQQKADILSKYV